MIKVYEKSNHLIIAVHKESYLDAVRIRNMMIGFGGYVDEVRKIDLIMEGWGRANEDKQDGQVQV
jgi:hypothetical protein